MLTSVESRPPLSRLEALVDRVNAGSIYKKLSALSLTPQRRQFIGSLVSFIASRERTGILSQWSEECSIAANLEDLGRATWADTGLLQELHSFGDESLVSREFRGFLQSHYLAAMTAVRRALPNDNISAWIERLRVLLMIRAVEAGDAGIWRESHLLNVCTEIRQICDATNLPKRLWIAPLVHPVVGFFDFIDESRYRCQKALQPSSAIDKSARPFLRDLLNVIDKNWSALKDESFPSIGIAVVPMPADTKPAGSTSSFIDAMADLPPDAPFFAAAQGTDESQGFAKADTDPAKSPPAQRLQGTGVLLQSLEHTQYLRHSWHRLSHYEETAFAQRALRLLEDTDFQNRLGAAMVVLATLTSNSARGVGFIPINSVLREDWTLDLFHGHLRRMPPRFERRWRASANPAASAWIRRLATEWRINLTSRLLAPLRESKHKKREARNIGDIWDHNFPDQPLESWFSDKFVKVPALDRLTSPVIANMLSQAAFDKTGDHAIARLIGSSTRTGLPSVCSYGAFTAAEVHQALEGAIDNDLAQLIAPAASDDRNAAGSELDVDFSLVGREIDRLRRRIETTGKDPQRWAEHHNLLCAMSVLALLASTGARPVTSPFESLNWIDFDARRVYVEDKHSGPTKGSRLCVLSDFVHDLLIQHFLPNLTRIAKELAPSAPEFSAEISKMLSGDPECRLPLFFFLRDEPALDWIEVSESQLSLTCEGRWSLPWNMFRHMHSTQLRRWGLHPEIRDALLAHGDRGAESHGDFSMRVPIEDLKAAQPLVNKLTASLGFTLPEPANATPAIGQHQYKDPGFIVSRVFGRAARTEQRALTRDLARRTAKTDIDRALAERPPSSLSPQDWDKIARAMLMRENGLPHSMASVRYEVFEEHLADIWREKGVHTKLPKRYVPIREGRGLFTEDVIGATAKIALLREKFDALVLELSDRDPRPVLAGCLAAIDLALFSRADNFTALTALICNHNSVRLIRFDNAFWFEWAYRGDWTNGRPVYRVPITDRAAAWIVGAQKNKKCLNKLPEAPGALSEFVKEVAPDTNGFIRQVTRLLSQINALELPGTIAAVLNGRRQSSALPHADWIRTTRLCAPLSTDGQPASAAPEILQQESEVILRNLHRPAVPTTAGSELTRCRALFDGIIEEINKTGDSTDKENKDPSNNESKDSTKKRKSEYSPDKKIAQILRLARSFGFAQGDAPHVLARYVCHLLGRPKKSSGKGRLQVSTTKRYWYSLMPGILDHAAGEDLTTLDEEELTELYGKIINTTVRNSKGRPDKISPVASNLDEGNGRERSLHQLLEFHNFARDVYGLEDPDWSEISPGITVGSGRPGIVQMDEYRVTLRTLLSSSHEDGLSEDLLSCAFVLLACARFGLRIGEATGLNRSDWLDVAGATVVLVRTNSTRRLKTDHSKRQVPLIGQFDETELMVVDEMLTRWEHREGSERDTPILPHIDSRRFDVTKARISGRLLEMIKRVTRNQASTVHHLRHGFAMRLLALLAGRTIGKGIQVTEGQCQEARRLLLGFDHPDRRTLWAIGRMLGHASPATTMKSYLHGLETWYPAVSSRASGKGFFDLSNVTDLDSLALDSNYLQHKYEAPTTLAPVESLILRYIRYLRLRSIGQSQRGAATRSRLTGNEAVVIDDMINHADHRLSGKTDRPIQTSALLAGISQKRWTNLAQIAQECVSSTESIQSVENWLPTVGSNRQVVLFHEEHFRLMKMFIESLKLEPNDCKLIFEKRIHPAVTQWAQGADLSLFLIERSEWGPNFQLDVATWGEPPVTARDRIAAVPRPNGRFRSTFEFLLLWIAWASTTTHGQPTPSH